MVFERREVEKSLKEKGFEREDGDHRFFRYYSLSDKRRTRIRTKTSHGSKKKDISKDIASQMAKQCKLDSKSFSKFIDCSLSQKEYQKIVEEKLGKDF